MMFHAQIAQRAFNTPLLVEPSKAMAFLSSLGPRITGRQLRLAGHEIAPEEMAKAALPTPTGMLTNALASGTKTSACKAVWVDNLTNCKVTNC